MSKENPKEVQSSSFTELEDTLDTSGKPSIDLDYLEKIEEEVRHTSEPEEEIPSEGLFSRIQSYFTRNKRLKETRTLAHIICNYHYNGASFEEIASSLSIDPILIKECVDEAKSQKLYEKLALEYEDF